MTGKALCEICGEPMPEGEAMFKFHGFSGDCPKPPKHETKTEVMIEYVRRKDRDTGELWLDIRVNRELLDAIGPFGTEAEYQRCSEDMLSTMRSFGAKDVSRA